MGKWHTESCAQSYSNCSMPEHTTAPYQHLLVEQVFPLIHSYSAFTLNSAGEGTRQTSLMVICAFYLKL